MDMLETAATIMEAASFCLKHHVRENNIDHTLIEKKYCRLKFHLRFVKSFLSHHIQ